MDTGGEPYFQARLEEKNMLNLCSDREFASSIEVAEEPGYTSAAPVQPQWLR